MSQFFQSFRYQGVNDSDGSPSNRPNVLQMLKSPRGRTIAVATVVALLLVFLVVTPPTDGLAKFRDDSIDSIDNWRHSSNATSTLPAACADAEEVDWSRFAYVQYVTNTAYLCNSVMLFEILHRLGSKADRLMMYPNNLNPEDLNTKEGRLLSKARDEYKVNLVPIQVQHKDGGDDTSSATWADSYTKLLAFNQTQYSRVLSLDSDSTVLQPMDELFLLPASPVAIPRAYWLEANDHVLSSQLLLVEPSAREFARMEREIAAAAPGVFDMDIVTEVYRYSALILPHRRYDLLTGEFRHEDHAKYLGSADEPWDPAAALAEAKFLHFSDWPVPKPWLAVDEQMLVEKQPKCVKDADGNETDCRAREIWRGFYSDFATRRKDICDLAVSPMSKRQMAEMVTRPANKWEAVF